MIDPLEAVMAVVLGATKWLEQPEINSNKNNTHELAVILIQSNTKQSDQDGRQ
jgi:hypothetical protein